MEEHPLTEQQKNMQEFMTAAWEVIGNYQDRLSSYEMIGILHGVMSKIEFDLNVRMANDEVKRMRDANKPSGLIDKGGFPIE